MYDIIFSCRFSRVCCILDAIVRISTSTCLRLQNLALLHGRSCRSRDLTRNFGALSYVWSLGQFGGLEWKYSLKWWNQSEMLRKNSFFRGLECGLKGGVRIFLIRPGKHAKTYLKLEDGQDTTEVTNLIRWLTQRWRTGSVLVCLVSCGYSSLWWLTVSDWWIFGSKALLLNLVFCCSC